MRLLDALAAQPEPVTLKELSATTGLHASTAHRILNDLVVGRYVERVDNGLYQLGMRLLELGSLVKGRLNVREAAIGAMRSLHKQTGQTINLSVQQGDEIVYIDRAWSERSGMQVVRAIGGRAPLHLTSTGKLFLSTYDTRLVRAYALRTGLAGHTRNSLTELDRLERELALVRRHVRARQRRAGTGRTLHRRRHLRRHRQAGRGPVHLGPGRAPAGRMDTPAGRCRRQHFRGARLRARRQQDPRASGCLSPAWPGDKAVRAGVAAIAP